MGTTNSKYKITAQDKAILDLKVQRDKLKQYQRNIQHILDREQQVAKECLAKGDKDKALLALRRRKYQENLLSKTYSQLNTLEELVATIEFSLVEQSVLHGLKQGNDVLKQIHKEMSIENVEKLLEDTYEAREYQREIDEMLANNITLEEEEAVQQEYEALRAEVTDKPIHLPSVPTDEIKTAEPEEAEPVRQEARERIALEAS